MDEAQLVHFHQNFELIYVLKGNMELTVEKETFKLKQEDVIMINTNKKHSYVASVDILTANFQVSYQILNEFLKTSLITFWCNSTFDMDASYDQLRNILKEILSHYLHMEGEQDFYQYSLHYKLMSILTSKFLINSSDERFAYQHNKYDERINEITNYIGNNYSQTIRLGDMADKLYLSVAYLSKFFKKEFGMNFIDYLNSIRLYHAVEDLIYTEGPITKIALDSGFSDVKIFNRLFKEVYKTSPTQFRKTNKTLKGISSDGNNKNNVNENIKAMLSEYFENNPIPEGKSQRKPDLFIVADTKHSVPLIRNWNRMINIGHASDLLRSDMQEHVLILKHQLGFKYIRFWGIFDYGMYIDIYDKKRKYNFDKIDKVLDFLTRNDIKPFIELGQKPVILHRKLGDELVFKEVERAFETLEEWENVITAFIYHIINRYGRGEVQSWYCELWRNNKIDNKIEYGDLYKVINGIIKQYVPELKVGGAGLTQEYGEKSEDELLKAWMNKDIQPDFISIYSYPYVRGSENGYSYAKRSSDPNILINRINGMKKLIEGTKIKFKEFMVTEWNATLSNRNYTNDSCFKAAYIMKNIIDSIHEVDLLGYWVGSDIFSEYYDSNVLLNGSVGILSKDGIPKPAFYGMDFMNRLGNKLIDKGENFIITEAAKDEYQIACHNYKHFNYYYYLKSEDSNDIAEDYKIFEDNEAICLKFQLRNMKNGKYNAKTYSVNRESGSVLDEWVKMNLTENITSSEIEYLKGICRPRVSIRQYQVDNELLNFEVHLSPHEINLIYITYLY